MEYGILFLLAIVVLCYLETLFSKLENRFIGLILPAALFLGSFYWLRYMDGFSLRSVVSAVFTILISNIPTYILLLIYRSKRKKLDKENAEREREKAELDKLIGK